MCDAYRRPVRVDVSVDDYYHAGLTNSKLYRISACIPPPHRNYIAFCIDVQHELRCSFAAVIRVCMCEFHCLTGWRHGVESGKRVCIVASVALVFFDAVVVFVGRQFNITGAGTVVKRNCVRERVRVAYRRCICVSTEINNAVAVTVTLCVRLCPPSDPLSLSLSL